MPGVLYELRPQRYRTNVLVSILTSFIRLPKSSFYPRKARKPQNNSINCATHAIHTTYPVANRHIHLNLFVFFAPFADHCFFWVYSGYRLSHRVRAFGIGSIAVLGRGHVACQFERLRELMNRRTRGVTFPATNNSEVGRSVGPGKLAPISFFRNHSFCKSFINSLVCSVLPAR